MSELSSYVNHMDERVIYDQLGVRLCISKTMWSSRYGDYMSLPGHPGWAIYHGFTVRNGDSVAEFGEDFGRPTHYREADWKPEEVFDLSGVAKKARKYGLAGAGTYGGGNLLDSLVPEDLVHWRRRPENPFDANAIEVYIRGRMVGHLPADMARVQAPMLDRLNGNVFLIGRCNQRPVREWQSIRLERPEPGALFRQAIAL